MEGHTHSECNAHLSVTIACLAPLQRFADVLATQVRSPSPAATSPDQVGSNLPPELLDGFRDEQIGQLYKLKLETTSYGRPLQAADKDGQ